MKYNNRFFGKIILSSLTLFVFFFCEKKQPFLKQTEDEITFVNKSSTLKIEKDPWMVSLFNTLGEEQFTEATPPSFLIDGEWKALRRIIDIKPTGKKSAEIKTELTDGIEATVLINGLSDFAFRIEIRLDKKEASAIRGSNALRPQEEVYGFGETWNGHVAQRGQSLVLLDHTGTPDECAYMPYYVTTSNYAFFLDYGGLVKVDVGKSNSDEIVYEAPTSNFSITLVSGDRIAEAVKHFITLAGLPTLPPRWAFQPWFWMAGCGTTPETNWDPRYRYKGSDVVEMAKRWRELDIPVGVCWFEPKWQTARNSFQAHEHFTTDLRALIDELHQLGFKVLGWTTPYTNPSSPNWQEGIEKGYIFGNPEDKTKIDKDPVAGENDYNYIDFTNPEARKWWQGEITKVLDAGLDGFKLDSGQKLPEDVALHNGKLGKDFHNAYALFYNRTFFEVLSKKYGRDFLMIPRAAWVGSGSYTNFKWPGDLNCTFDDNGLPAALYSVLSLSFCGLPFIAEDIGGYHGRLNPEEDVWVRWSQLGAFIPGMETLYMPWWYSNKAMEHYKYLSWLHKELIPFWMSLAHEAHETGAPICRHLVWTFQDDIDSWRIDDEYTLGEAILVAPVITPENRREVYLPPGVWHDFWDNSYTIQGPSKLNWEGDLWHFPLFIKEGAIIPMEVSRDITGFGWPESAEYVTVAVWPKSSGSSQFRFHDQEEPVMFKVQKDENGATLIKWSQSAKDYLFRLYWKSDNSIEEVIAGTGKKRINLPKAEDLPSFRKSKVDGWFMDVTTNKLWIRKIADKYSGEIQIQ